MSRKNLGRVCLHNAILIFCSLQPRYPIHFLLAPPFSLYYNFILIFQPSNLSFSAHSHLLSIMAAILDHAAENIIDIHITPAPSSKLIYFLYPGLLMTLLLPAYRFVLKDYQAFLALGPGGTPKTFPGYLRVSYLRLFAISDPFRPPSLAETVFPTNAYLRQLPQRSGPRPIVAGIAPHRQLNQKCTAELHHRLRDGLHQLAAGFPSLIRKGTSCFEKNGLALFLFACTLSASPNTSHPGFSHLNPTCQDTGEICHLHASVSRPSSTIPTGRSIFGILLERSSRSRTSGTFSQNRTSIFLCSLYLRHRTVRCIFARNRLLS